MVISFIKSYQIIVMIIKTLCALLKFNILTIAWMHRIALVNDKWKLLMKIVPLRALGTEISDDFDISDISLIFFSFNYIGYITDFLVL